MSIKHIYEHLLEHFICLKSFIITVKFSCYALWAKSWSTFSLNSHWLQQQADLIVCGFPYQFNTALKKMGSLVSTILDRKSQHLAALNIHWIQPSNEIKTNKPHTHKSVTSTVHYKTQPCTCTSTRYAGIPSRNGVVGCTTINYSLSDHSQCCCHPNLVLCMKAMSALCLLTHPDSHSPPQQYKAGTNHAEPEVAADELESKEDVVEKNMPEVWLIWRCSLQLFFWQSLTTWLHRSNTAPHSLEKNRTPGSPHWAPVRKFNLNWNYLKSLLCPLLLKVQK